MDAGNLNVQVVAFSRFVDFWLEVFSRDALLQNVACAQSFKDYVPQYYSRMFGSDVKSVSSRHLKWLRRMEPLLSLPQGSTIVDFGGGYGLDSIFFASLGYSVIFYELTVNHIAIAGFFRDLWQDRFGPVRMKTVLAGENAQFEADAVFLDEVAHHVEPPEKAFRQASLMLHKGGHLFLLEPNYLSIPTQLYFFKARGFKTVITQVDPKTHEPVLYGNEHIRPSTSWNRIARHAGFQLLKAHYIIPWLMTDKKTVRFSTRGFLEKIPVVQHLLASHITHHYKMVG